MTTRSPPLPLPTSYYRFRIACCDMFFSFKFFLWSNFALVKKNKYLLHWKIRLHIVNACLGAAVAYWLDGRIPSASSILPWRILFRKFEKLSESCTITAVINYRCYPVTPSRQQLKYALGASGPLAMGTNYQKMFSPFSIRSFPWFLSISILFLKINRSEWSSLFGFLRQFRRQL